MDDNEVIAHDADKFNAVAVESKGLNVLILRSIDYPWINAAGQICAWELEYRWLSQMDPDLCCVLGSDFTFYPSSEVNPKGSLFEQFNLF